MSSRQAHPCASHGCDDCATCQSGRCCMTVGRQSTTDLFAEAMALDSRQTPSWVELLAADAASNAELPPAEPNLPTEFVPPPIVAPPMYRPAAEPTQGTEPPLALPPARPPAAGRELPPGRQWNDPLLDDLLNRHTNHSPGPP